MSAADTDALTVIAYVMLRHNADQLHLSVLLFFSDFILFYFCRSIIDYWVHCIYWLWIMYIMYVRLSHIIKIIYLLAINITLTALFILSSTWAAPELVDCMAWGVHCKVWGQLLAYRRLWFSFDNALYGGLQRPALTTGGGSTDA